MNTKKRTTTLALLGILIAIEMVLTFTPLGFIPLGFMNATTLHIPVVIGAVFLGPIEGGILGFAFGILSVVKNTFMPNVTSFVFSPFYTLGDFQGNILSLVIAIVPRILVGVVAYYSFAFTAKHVKSKAFAYGIAGVAGALTNTILVMGGIYVFFGNAYAQATGRSVEKLFMAIMTIIGINGVPEAIVGAIVVSAICKVLSQVFVQRKPV